MEEYLLVCRALTAGCKKASSLPCYYIISISYTLVKKLVQTARQGEEKVIFLSVFVPIVSAELLVVKKY